MLCDEREGGMQGCDVGVDGKQVQQGGDMCIADSLHCAAEAQCCKATKFQGFFKKTKVIGLAQTGVMSTKDCSWGTDSMHFKNPYTRTRLHYFGVQESEDIPPSEGP